MKNYFLLFFGLLIFSISAQTTPKIKAVKVFSNGAQISRVSNIKLKEGIDTLKINGISAFLNQQTIQAKVNGAKILDIKFNTTFTKKVKEEPKLAQIKNQIKTIEKDLLNLNDDLAYLKIEKDLILSNKKISNEETLDVEDVKDFVSYYKNKLPGLIRKITDTQQQIKKFNEVKSKLQKEVKALQKVSTKKTGEINIIYLAKQNRQATLELRYHVTRCGWSPLYNMRASNIGEPIQFEYNAMVYQNTGVNWENADLTIATGNPILGGTKPELYPWRLNNVSRVNYKSKNAGYAWSLEEAEDDLEEGALSPSKHESMRGDDRVTQSESLTFSKFEIPVKFSLNTGAGEKNINILKRSLPASYQYYAAPKIGTSVYLLAQVTEWEKMPLIPGKSLIYFDETFVGKSYLNPKTMKDTLDVSLGQDQSILVERKKQEGKCINKSNLLGASKERGFEVTVKNNRNKAIKIEIVDQIPISKNNKIKVEHKLDSNWDLNEETGILEWNIEVPAGEKKSASFEFEVKHPKNFNVPL